MKPKIQIAILLASCILSIKTYAQIFYQDISPDVIINTWNMHDVHIDSLATSVLSYGAPGNLTIWQEFGSQIAVNAFSNCQVLMTGAYPSALNQSQLIDATGTWVQPNYAILNNGTQGNWISAIDKFLGVRVYNGAQWLYGWIRMDVNTAGNSVTIKDYACNRTVNAPIYAGQTITGINDLSNMSKNLITVYPNPFNSWTTVKTSEILNNATLTIYNSVGQLTKIIKSISGKEIIFRRDNLPVGYYLIQINQDNKYISTSKLIITD